MLKFNNEINAKALQILEDREKARKIYEHLLEYEQRCIDANICPMCGSILKSSSKPHHRGYTAKVSCPSETCDYEKQTENVEFKDGM
jgi:hypothetical protein